jgi:tetratricopeptide (TPR) repeat protein
MLTRPAWLATAAVVLAAAAVVFLRLALAPAAPIHKIAVLPLERGAGIEEYQAEDVTDGIHQILSMASDLSVVSGRSTRVVASTNLSSAAIANQLKADALVEGRLGRDPQGLHLTLRLISAGTDASIWSEEFSAPITGLLGLQAQAGRALAKRLGVTVPPDRLVRFSASSSANAPAVDAMQRARWHLNRFKDDEFPEAIRLYREAIALEPSLAPAYAGLARALMYTALNPQQPAPRDFTAAKEAAERAIALDPTLAEAHAVLGQIAFQSWRWKEAELAFQQARASDPGNEYATERYAFFLAGRGQPEQGLQEMIRLRELDPLSPVAGIATAVALQYAGRYDQALTEVERAIQLDSSNPMGHVVHGRALAASGRFDEAKQAFARAQGSNAGPDYLREEIAAADAGAGRRAEALATAHDLEQLFAAAPGREQPELLAYLYARLDDNDKAFAWLDRALDVAPDRMLWLKVDPRLQSLHSDPRFSVLLAKLGLRP